MERLAVDRICYGLLDFKVALLVGLAGGTRVADSDLTAGGRIAWALPSPQERW